MIDPADGRQLEPLLRRHRITLQHRFGQNFLIDPGLRDAIADGAAVSAEDEVLEVGAGVGTLTRALATRCRRVVAVEIDRTLITALREVIAGTANVEIVEADILRFDVAAAFPQGGHVVAGNIPYNLTGALIAKLLEPEPRPKRLSLVVQHEVAERWAADTTAGLATLAVQVFARARIRMKIPAAAFEPVPRVDSALVVLDVRDRPAIEVGDFRAFFRFAEGVFQFRRKQLGGTLGRIAHVPNAQAAATLAGVGIEPTRRPQTLSLDEWEALYRAFNPALGR